MQCALPLEAELVTTHLEDAQSHDILNYAVTEGVYENVHVVVCVGGMGAAASAAATQFLVDRYEPRSIIFSGIAGSLNSGLMVGDIIVAAEQHYAETNTQIIAECAPFREFFPSDAVLVDKAVQAAQALGFARIPSQHELRDGDASARSESVKDARARFVVGNISTSDRFNIDPEVLRGLVERFDAEGEAMEEAPAAQIAGKCGVPFLCIRGISNPCGEAYDDLNESERDMKLAADNAGEVTLGVIARL